MIRVIGKIENVCNPNARHGNEYLRQLHHVTAVRHSRDNERAEPWPREWLLIKRPESEKEPTKYRLSNVSEKTDFTRLVDLVKLRWRISSTIIAISSRRSGLDTLKGEGGLATIITRPRASRPTDS